MNKKLYKSISYILLFLIIFSGMSVASAKEEPTAKYQGSPLSAFILDNVSYSDVRKSNTWAKPAIYEIGAMNLMKGYGRNVDGDRIFGLGDELTVEQALAIAYNAVGREAEAQKAAEALDVIRAQNDKLKPALKMWSDGYIQLALNDGLITFEDYNDAINKDQNELKEDDFNRAEPVKRENMAFFMAKLLGLEPEYGQIKLFNQYMDWSEAEPVRVPYLEAIVLNKVMNGTDERYFYPKGILKREEAAQILKNSEPIINKILGYEKKEGYIIDITRITDFTNKQEWDMDTINIRSSDGMLNTITVSEASAELDPKKVELNGASIKPDYKQLAVLKGGVLGNSTLLSPFDRIEYIVEEDSGSVVFVNVLNDKAFERYLLSRVTMLDTSDKKLEVIPIANLPKPDIESIEQEDFEIDDNQKEIYRLSNDLQVIENDLKTDLSIISENSDVIATIENGIVKKIEKVDLTYRVEKGIYTGTVEDNNYQLGYITLFFEDASGIEQIKSGNTSALRTFYYPLGALDKVMKDSKIVEPNAITEGDRVFIKLDDNNKISIISASSDLYPVYGTIERKSTSSLLVSFDDGHCIR